MINPAFSSGLASVLQRYVGMKRALGRQFDSATHALQSLDRLLAQKGYTDLTAAAFNAWCKTQEHLASGVRRVRMLDVHAFCVYRRRTEPECFLPDLTSFPPYHQRLRPHIFTESEVARLMEAASRLKCNPSTPAPSRTHTSGHRASVHYRYPAWRAYESDRSRLRPAGGNASRSGDEVLQVSIAADSRRILRMRSISIFLPGQS